MRLIELYNIINNISLNIQILKFVISNYLFHTLLLFYKCFGKMLSMAKKYTNMPLMKENNDRMPKSGNKQLQKRRNDKYKNNKIIIYPL